MVEDRETTVHDRVQQRVHEPAGLSPKLTVIAKPAFSGLTELKQRPPMHGDHVIRADKDLDLAQTQLMVFIPSSVEDQEVMVLILFHLGPLVAATHILEGQLVEA